MLFLSISSRLLFFKFISAAQARAINTFGAPAPAHCLIVLNFTLLFIFGLPNRTMISLISALALSHYVWLWFQLKSHSTIVYSITTSFSTDSVIKFRNSDEHSSQPRFGDIYLFILIGTRAGAEPISIWMLWLFFFYGLAQACAESVHWMCAKEMKLSPMKCYSMSQMTRYFVCMAECKKHNCSIHTRAAPNPYTWLYLTANVNLWRWRHSRSARKRRRKNAKENGISMSDTLIWCVHKDVALLLISALSIECSPIQNLNIYFPFTRKKIAWNFHPFKWHESRTAVAAVATRNFSGIWASDGSTYRVMFRDYD